MSDRPHRLSQILRAAAALALLLVLVGATVAVWQYRSGAFGLAPNADAIETQIKAWGQWAVAASILLMVAHSLIPFPAEFVTIANGMLFGPVWGTLITWSGAMLGASLAFALARWLGRPFVQAMLGDSRREGIERWAQRQGIGVLIAARLIPLISFNLINYAAGLAPISWWTFLWTTGLGILPLTTLMVVTGHELWHGGGTAWIYLVAATLGGGLIWFAAARWAGRPP